jgi:phosphohistidine phosphatase SixA
VAACYGAPKPKRVDALLPDGDRAEVLSWLEEQGEAETIAIVGHEPSLGLLASWLLASPLSHFVEFKKGGACLISWSSRPAAGTGWLQWALGPGPLRRLG